MSVLLYLQLNGRGNKRVNINGMVGCKCGGICNDKHCPCQKDNLSCGDGCRCSSDKCMNRIKRPDIRGFFLPPSKKPRPSSPLISESSNDIEDEDNDINCSTSTEGTQDTSNKKNDTSYKCTMEVCPICILRLPTLYTGRKYMMCCGKVICSGCLHAPRYDDLGNIVDNRKCAFCRTRWPKSNREVVQSLEKRVELDDPIAIYNMGCDYQDGTCGRPQNHAKALELYHRAAELGYVASYNNIGYAYNNGEGVDVDKKKARHYYELAAIGGDPIARYNLGEMDEEAGNIERALKHYMIAVRDGDAESLTAIQRLYSNGLATKEDYTKALQLYQTYLNEIKSKQRDKAAAYRKRCRYYFT